MVHLNLQQWEQAITDYTKAIGYKPGDAVAYYDRGKARFEFGQDKLATLDYERAVELNPIFANAFYDR